MATVLAPMRALPRPYLAWLIGVSVSQLGDAVLYFALGWAASGLGGTTAALALTLSGLPRLVLLLVGGAVADRLGARRVLIAGEAALLALTAGLAVATSHLGTPAWLLLASALLLGTVTAFCLPASGSMPRRLVADDDLPRALALRQGVSQAVLMTGAPLGGLLVGSVGLAAVAWADAATFAFALCVLVAIRERAWTALEPSTPNPQAERLSTLRTVLRTPGLPTALVLVGAGAALILPTTSLLVPLLGHASGWDPDRTGVVIGAQGAGVVGAALLAARRRTTTHSPYRGAARGLVASAAGALTLASSAALPGLATSTAATAATTAATAAAAVGALVLGLGSGIFVARLAPVVLGTAPRTHLARVQALVGLAQVAPVLVANTALGALAEYTSPAWALATVAAGLAACAAAARLVAARTPDRPA